MGPVPNGHDPDGLRLNTVEEPIGRNDDLAIRQVRKFGNVPTRHRKPLQPPLRVAANARGCAGIVAANVGNGSEKLDSLALNPERTAANC